MTTVSDEFGQRLLVLRKRKGWSQPELAKKLGTSGPIIGRYERGEMTPSVEVAKRLADIFAVTVDYLVSDKALPRSLQDQSMLQRWRAIDELEAPERERILSVVDSLLRDAKARQTYQLNGV